MPWNKIQPITRSTISPEPDNHTLSYGSSLKMNYKINGIIPSNATILLWYNDLKEPKEFNAEIQNNNFTFSLNKLINSFEYQIITGDYRSQIKEVKILPEPRIIATDIKLTYPEYTLKPPIQLLNIPENINFYKGSSLTFLFTIDSEINKLKAISTNSGLSYPFEKKSEKIWKLNFAPIKSDELKFEYINNNSDLNILSPKVKLSLLNDNKPKINIFSRKQELNPDDVFIQLKISASDDLSLKQLKLKFKYSTEDTWNYFESFDLNSSRFSKELTIPLEILKIPKDARIIQFIAECSDNNPANLSPAESHPVIINILDRYSYLFSLLKTYSELTSALKKNIISKLLNRKKSNEINITLNLLHYNMKNLKKENLSNITLFRNIEEISNLLNESIQYEDKLKIIKLIDIYKELSLNESKLTTKLLLETFKHFIDKVNNESSDIYLEYAKLSDLLSSSTNYYHKVNQTNMARLFEKIYNQFTKDDLQKLIKNFVLENFKGKQKILEYCENIKNNIQSLNRYKNIINNEQIKSLLNNEINYLLKVKHLINIINTEAGHKISTKIPNLIIKSSENITELKILSPDSGIKGNTLLESALFDINLMIDFIRADSPSKAKSKQNKAIDSINRCIDNLQTIINKLKHTVSTSNQPTRKSDYASEIINNSYVKILSPENHSAYYPNDKINCSLQVDSVFPIEQIFCDIAISDSFQEEISKTLLVGEYPELPRKKLVNFSIDLNKLKLIKGRTSIQFRVNTINNNDIIELTSEEIILQINHFSLSNTIADTFIFRKELQKQYNDIKSYIKIFINKTESFEKKLIKNDKLESSDIQQLYTIHSNYSSEFFIAAKMTKTQFQKKNIKSIKNSFSSIIEQNNNFTSIINKQKKNILYLLDKVSQDKNASSLSLHLLVEINSQAKALKEILDFIDQSILNNILTQFAPEENSTTSSFRNFISNIEYRSDELINMAEQKNIDIFTYLENENYINDLIESSAKISHLSQEKFTRIINKYKNLFSSADMDKSKILLSEFCSSLNNMLTNSSVKYLNKINKKEIILDNENINPFKQIINDLTINGQDTFSAELMLLDQINLTEADKIRQSHTISKMIDLSLPDEKLLKLFQTRIIMLYDRFAELNKKENLSEGDQSYFINLIKLLDILNANIEKNKFNFKAEHPVLKEINIKISAIDNYINAINKSFQNSRIHFEKKYTKEKQKQLEILQNISENKELKIEYIISNLEKILRIKNKKSFDVELSSIMEDFFSFYNHLTIKEKEIFINNSNLHLRIFNNIFYIIKSFKDNSQYIDFYIKRTNLNKTELSSAIPLINRANTNREFNRIKEKEIKNLQSELATISKEKMLLQEKINKFNAKLNKSNDDTAAIKDLNFQLSELELKKSEITKEIEKIKQLSNISIDIEIKSLASKELISKFKLSDNKRLLPKKTSHETTEALIIRNFSEELDEIENQAINLDERKKRLTDLSERLSLFSGQKVENETNSIKDTINFKKTQLKIKEKNHSTAELLTALADAAENFDTIDKTQESDSNTITTKLRYLNNIRSKTANLKNTINLIDHNSSLSEKLHKLAKKINNIDHEINSIDLFKIDISDVDLDPFANELNNISNIILEEAKIIIAPHSPQKFNSSDYEPVPLFDLDQNFPEYEMKIHNYLSRISSRE